MTISFCRRSISKFSSTPHQPKDPHLCQDSLLSSLLQLLFFQHFFWPCSATCDHKPTPLLLSCLLLLHSLTSSMSSLFIKERFKANASPSSQISTETAVLMGVEILQKNTVNINFPPQAVHCYCCFPLLTPFSLLPAWGSFLFLGYQTSGDYREWKDFTVFHQVANWIWLHENYTENNGERRKCFLD